MQPINAPDPEAIETRKLLTEIRDLLLPVSDAYRDQYEVRLAEREVERIAAIRALLSTPKRSKAWALADGSRKQREIAKLSGLAESGASTLFKRLRDLDAVTDSPNPTRTLEVNL